MARVIRQAAPALTQADRQRLRAIVCAVEAGEAVLEVLLDVWEALAVPASEATLPAYRHRDGTWVTAGADAVLDAIKAYLERRNT